MDEPKYGKLVLQRGKGQKVFIRYGGELLTIQIEGFRAGQYNGMNARISFSGPKSFSIQREEIIERDEGSDHAS